MTKDLGRRLVAETLGTFGIVFAPVAFSGAMAHAVGQGSLLGAALVSGLAVTGMISAFGPISAAHFNPAVTAGFVAAGRFPRRLLLPYWAAQLIGSAAAAGTCGFLFGAGHGVHMPTTDPVRAVFMEGILTLLLMLVIMAVATDRRVDGALPALSIGLTVIAGVMVGGTVTGGSMNPARSIGPALFSTTALPVVWMYALGPIVGAVAAGRIFEAIRISPAHATGAPNELFEALDEIRTS